MSKVLFQFKHGIGDATQFTAVLQHLQKHQPDWEMHLETTIGKHSVAQGYCKQVWTDKDKKPDPKTFDKVFKLDWREGTVQPDCPSTKACKCLKDVFSIKPDWELLSYRIAIQDDARKRVDAYLHSLPLENGFVVLHYQGNTSQSKKDLTHDEAAEICRFFAGYKIPVVILDWDKRTPLVDNNFVFCPATDNPLWMNTGTGDAETMAALISKARLFIGIDSGPQKVALATDVPTFCVWIQHHPIHYVDRADNALHFVPSNHREFIKGDKAKALAFFERHYKSVEYQGSLASVICSQAMKTLGLNPMPETAPLTSTAFDELYYREHLACGLNYNTFGDWQKAYGRWIVEALDMKGKRILDVGCAAGAIAKGLAEAGADVCGLDPNEYTVNLGRATRPEIPLFICDAINAHYWKDATFDLVHSQQVFEHFKPELVSFILKELWRIAKPGGILFFVCDTAELFARQGRGANEDATHTCIKPCAWWEAQLREAGWVSISQDSLKAHSSSFFAKYDWDSFTAQKAFA